MDGMKYALLCALVLSGQLMAAEFGGFWTGLMADADVSLTLNQQGREITGTIVYAQGTTAPIRNVGLNGNELTFEARGNSIIRSGPAPTATRNA